VLHEALAVFERLSLPAQVTYCLEHICIVDLQQADYGTVESNLQRIAAINDERSTFYAHAVEYEIRVRLAFETNSAAPLDGFVVQRRLLAPFARAPRTQINIAALELGEKLILGNTQLRESVQLVQSLYKHLKNRCDQDFTVSVLASAMGSLGHESEASAAVRQYLEIERREQEYLLPSLSRLASRLGVAVPERYAQNSPTVVGPERN
jgi:hypothetical protein